MELMTIDIPKEYGVTDAKISEIAGKYKDITEIKDAAGLQMAKAGRRECRELRVAVEHKRKELKADALEYGRKVDGEAKRITAALEEIENPLDKLIKEEEGKEKRRVDGIRNAIQFFHNTTQCQFESADELAINLEHIKGIAIDESFAELQGEAQMAKDCAVKVLEDLLAKTRKAEADQAELDRLRKAEAERLAKEEAERLEREKKEREERIAREAAEKAQREAAESARQTIAEAERKEREAREAAERAEREKTEAAARSKAEQEAAVKAAEERARLEAERVERERLAKEAADRAEQKRLADEAAKKAADVEHRRQVNNSALEGLKAAGLSEAMAKKVITAIASGLVPNVVIKY